MSAILKKVRGPKVAVTVKLDLLELMGQAVADKDMFCVHWAMRGLRGRESTGDTDNVRAAIPDGSSYPVARFTDVFTGEVHPKSHKGGNGYDPMEFDMRVVCPALHKKDEKAIGRATINIFEKVPLLTAGQPQPSDQTVPLTKDGSAVAHVKFTLSLKGEAPAEAADEPVDVDQPVSPTSSAASEPAGIVVTPPATPQKDAGSETATSGTSDIKEESESKSRHRKRHSSSNAAALNAQLKKKDEELKQMEDQLKQKDEELQKKDEELKKKDDECVEKQKEIGSELEAAKVELAELRKSNEFLESRVKELEKAKEMTDVVPADPEQEKMRDDLAKLQEDKERLEEEKLRLADELEQARKEIDELEARPAGDNSQSKELEVLNQQLAALKEELENAKKGSGNAAPAPAGNGMVMQAVFAAVGAILGIIIGHFI